MKKSKKLSFRIIAIMIITIAIIKNYVYADVVVPGSSSGTTTISKYLPPYYIAIIIVIAIVVAISIFILRKIYKSNQLEEKNKEGEENGKVDKS